MSSVSAYHWHITNAWGHRETYWGAAATCVGRQLSSPETWGSKGVDPCLRCGAVCRATVSPTVGGVAPCRATSSCTSTLNTLIFSSFVVVLTATGAGYVFRGPYQAKTVTLVYVLSVVPVHDAVAWHSAAPSAGGGALPLHGKRCRTVELGPRPKG